jgi:ferric-dicitrate binding protein FerR (iron transport regulator)
MLQIPHLILNFLKYIFMISVYLDQRFGLHQRAAVVGVNVLEGLVEVEKEVGLMRGLGEGLSVLWQASPLLPALLLLR